MEFPDLTTLSVDEVRQLRTNNLMKMEAIRQHEDGVDISYTEAVRRKNACNDELIRRDEPITASGISTARSKALGQRVQA